MKRLTIAIDDLATLRYLLNDNDFDPARFAVLCEVAGAHGLSLTLGNDQRGIRERDAQFIKKMHKSFLNIHIPPEPQIMKAVLSISPDMVTLVETADSGRAFSPLPADILQETLPEVLPDFHANNISVAAFCTPEINAIKQLNRARLDYVELDCTEYTLAKDSNEELVALDKLNSATLAAAKLGLGVNCYGNIHYLHLPGLAAIPRLEDICMGISVIKRALLVGVDQAIKEALQQILFYQREQ